MNVAAVIPTRNEATTIGPLVRQLDGFCDAVIVADDSNDGTRIVAQSAGAIVIDAPPGLGPAYKAAWKHIPSDWQILHIDAGGSHEPDTALSVLDFAQSLEEDITIGSRFVDGSHFEGSWWRGFCSRRMALACSLATRRNVHDWTSGMRVYSPDARKAIARHRFRTAGHAWQIEALWVAFLAGCTVREVPIDYYSSTSQLSRARAYEAVKLLGHMASVR